MIYSDKCYNCEERIKHIEPYHENAKEFYRKYRTSYSFACGAVYDPRYMNVMGYEIHQTRCEKDFKLKIHVEDMLGIYLKPKPQE